MNESRMLGIHHVTAIAGDPQANVDFYAGVLGLRLVKKTVNFDDPGTYHLYYGDEVGYPGTIMTFFPWPGARRGQRGAGQVTVTSFSIPRGSMGYWAKRLARHGTDIVAADDRFDEEVLTFHAPDGLKLELVAHEEAREPWKGGPVPAEHAVRGCYSVTLSEQRHESTAMLLTGVMGFRLRGEQPDRLRFEAPVGSGASRVDVVSAPSAGLGRIAVGTVHHVAFRVANDAAQLRWRERLVEHGVDATPVMDRQYFRSVYFREPGGVLFELATDPPGFAVDEPVAELGTNLKLPPWLEPQRSRVERVLPALRSPRATTHA